MMMSARYRRSKRFPNESWVEIKGLGEGTTGINIGQAYSLRDAISACLDEWEKEEKELLKEKHDCDKKCDGCPSSDTCPESSK